MTENLINIIDSALSSLSPRKQQVILARYNPNRRRTLQEIGDELGVTKERVRQIEHKAKRQLRHLCKDYIEEAFFNNPASVWQAIAGSATMISTENWDVQVRKSPAQVQLAFDLCDMTPASWLRNHAPQYNGSWIMPGKSAEHITEKLLRLSESLENVTLPAPLSTIKVPLSGEQLASLINHVGLYVEGDFVCASRPKARVRRAIDLHGLLSREGVLGLDLLVNKYHSLRPGVKSSHREVESTLRSFPHLFIQLVDGIWATVPVESSTSDASSGTKYLAFSALCPPLAGAFLGKISESSIAKRIAGLLEAEGPMRLSEIQSRLSSGRGLNANPLSIGPTLLTYSHLFRRLLPGIYGLRTNSHFDTSEAAVRRIPQVFTEQQIVLYSSARHSGIPLYTFPFWTPTTEALWVEWASRNAKPAVFESILSVSTPTHWPSHLRTDRLSRMMASPHRYRLWVEPRLQGANTPPLDRLLAAALFANKAGGLGWVAANRVMQRRMTDTSAAAHMVILVSMGILSASVTHWQLPHPTGPHIEEVISQLANGLQSQGNLDWDSELGESLRRRALAFEAPATSWVSNDLIVQVLEPSLAAPSISNSVPPQSASPLQALLEEDALVSQSNDLEEALQLLSSAGDVEASDI